jgi:hypothetical protein
LPLLSANEEIDERKVQRGGDERRRRSEEERRSDVMSVAWGSSEITRMLCA